jgi:hypothetical protein
MMSRRNLVMLASVYAVAAVLLAVVAFANAIFEFADRALSLIAAALSIVAALVAGSAWFLTSSARQWDSPTRSTDAATRRSAISVRAAVWTLTLATVVAIVGVLGGSDVVFWSVMAGFTIILLLVEGYLALRSPAPHARRRPNDDHR